MCLYPRVRANPKYKPNKKNGGEIPRFIDDRVLGVPTGCGRCIECRNQKARNWLTRLTEDIKTHKNGKFVTLTLSNESIHEIMNLPQNKEDIKKGIDLKKLTGYKLDNEIATKAVKMFNNRWRKEHKKAIRHWLVTELGHNGTENIHLHGILWTDESFATIKRIWKYGWIWPREEYDMKNNYVTARTINYITKYVTKIDPKHKYYRSLILTSPGIGADYVKTARAKLNKFNESDTDETYRTDTGHKIALPTYWRNKLYTEEEREALWLHKMDKKERYVNGLRIDISRSEKEYYAVLEQARILNKQLGYGTDHKDWKRETYEHERRILLQNKRIKSTKIPQETKRSYLKGWTPITEWE